MDGTDSAPAATRTDPPHDRPRESMYLLGFGDVPSRPAGGARVRPKDRAVSHPPAPRQAGARRVRRVTARALAERTQVDGLLGSSEREYRLLFERANDAIVIFDPDGEIILDVNPRACELYGVSRERLIGASLRDFTRDVARGERHLRTLVAEGQYDSFETVQCRADGEPLYLLINASMIDFGGRRAVLSINRDITERRRLEEALREREARQRQMFENHPAMQLLVDPATGQIVDANPAACAFYGYRREELLAMRVHELSASSPTDVATVLERASTEPRDVVYSRLHLASGEVREVEVRTGPVESGGRRLLFAIIHDVTERKRVEETLEHERAFMSAVLENLGDGIVACDADGRLTLFNRATRAFHGVPEASLPAEAWAERYDLYRPDGRTPLGREEIPLFRALQGEVVHNAEMVIAPKHGPARTLLASGRAIADAQGHKLGAVVAMHDISERRWAEEQLRRQNAHLAALHEVSLGLVNRLDSAGVLEAAMQHAAKLLGTDHGYLALVADGGEKLVKTVSLGAFDTGTRGPLLTGMGGPPLRKGEGVAGMVWETGQPLALDDYYAWPGHLAIPGFIGAIVAVPLVASGEVIGVLGLAHIEEGRTFDPDAIALLERLAALVVISLENARLYRAAQDEIEERRRAEMGLAAAQRIAHLGSWEWEIATGALTWSDETFRVFGLVPGSFPPTFERFLAAVHPEDRAATAAAIEAALGGLPYVTEMRAIRPDGTIRVIEAEGEVARDERGRPIRMIGTGLDITPRKRAEEQLHRQAYTDTLTGLPNRHAFIEHLAGARRAASGEATRIAVLFLDLDRFKNINDSLGHHRGDELLALVAERLRGCMDAGATVARFGGDEFAILLEGIDAPGDAIAAAERVHACLRPPLRLHGLDLRVGASIGIETGGRRPDADALLRDADTAMYRAKAGGRGRTALFDAGMRAAVTEKLNLETDLQRAVERDEFRLAYQPIVELATGRVTGFEALARWKHPTRGTLMPDVFIPLAEETGLIAPLGALVLRTACRQLRAWREGTPAGESLTMGVNLSGHQLAQPDLAARVAAALAETGIPPASLHLEITESALVADTEGARATLAQVHDLGVGIYLDDFGVEYSSLNYLRRFPIDAIKIDRSFIGDLLVSEKDRTVVRAIAALAHGLGLRVTAEGVETFEQKAWLEMLGCDRGQGYFFGKPMDARDAQALLVPEPMMDAGRPPRAAS